jgi:hypothetical protein
MVQVSLLRVQGAGFRVQGAGFKVLGAGCRVQGAGCTVQGSGFRVQGYDPSTNSEKASGFMSDIIVAAFPSTNVNTLV